MLQIFLVGVYADYTACQYTHDDLLEHLMEKFKVMSDPAQDHPWHRVGFRFLLAGCRGDLKWLNDLWQRLNMCNVYSFFEFRACKGLKELYRIMATQGLYIIFYIVYRYIRFILYMGKEIYRIQT